MANVLNSKLAAERIVDPVLTQLVRGYSNNEFIGDKLFPIVGVEKESGKVPYFGKENFRIYDAKRALRADSNDINVAGALTTTYSLEEYDLQAKIDYREVSEDLFDIRKRQAQVTMDGIMLAREYKQATIAQAAGTYASTNKTALSTNINDTDQDPVAVITAAQTAIRAVIGKKANIGYIASDVYDVLMQHPLLLERIKYSQAGVLDKEWLKKLFGLDEIYVGQAIYTADDTTFTDVWKDTIILAYQPKSTGKNSMYQPAFGYTFQKNGQPMVDKRVENGGKIEVIRTTDIYDVNVVGAEAAYLIYGCLT